jgi:hypothetical protein
MGWVYWIGGRKVDKWGEMLYLNALTLSLNKPQVIIVPISVPAFVFA